MWVTEVGIIRVFRVIRVFRIFRVIKLKTNTIFIDKENG